MICGRETRPDQISRNNRHPHHLHEHTLTTDPLTPVNGELAVPEGPGLNVELDREALEHNTLEELQSVMLLRLRSRFCRNSPFPPHVLV